MQQSETRVISPFKNYYCASLPCGVGKYYKFKDDDVRLLLEDEILTLCEMAISKNVLAGVREVYLKLPHFIDINYLFEKYDVQGKIILPAIQIYDVPTKALVGNNLIIEIESLADMSENLLNDVANFIGEQKLDVMLNLGSSLNEVGKVVSRFGMSPTELAESYGFLDRKCYVRGLNYVDKDDLLLLKNYNAFAILTPRDDGEHGRGIVNNYNLIYHEFPFGFGSGECYNIDMLGEGKLSCINTANLMNEGGIIKLNDVLEALSSKNGHKIAVACDGIEDSLLEERVCLGKVNTDLNEKVKQIAKKLKEKN